MSLETEAHVTAKGAVDSLFFNVNRSYDRNSPPVPAIHRGPKYESAALKHSFFANMLEASYTPLIDKAAERITVLSGRGWENDAQCVDLWRKVALTVTNFSEHPTKKVATLIIDEKGQLQAFCANRIPHGIPKMGKYYVEGDRRNYIVCSERRAIASDFNISVELPKDKTPLDYDSHLRSNIHQLTEDIRLAALNGASLQNSFILITAPPCMVCAETIAAVEPKGIIIVGELSTDFKCAKDCVRAKELIERHDIPVILTTTPSFQPPAKFKKGICI